MCVVIGAFSVILFQFIRICAVLSSPVPYSDERMGLMVIFLIKQQDIHNIVPFLPGYNVHLSPINNPKCNAFVR